MTVREYFENYLKVNGLWPNEATAVMDAVIASGPGKEMADRWAEDVESYEPTPLLPVITVHVRDEAVKWIDANKPEHFARGMFV